MPAARKPRAPTHLSARSKGLWKRILEDYELDAAELVLLRAGLEHLDIHDQAIAHVHAHGPVVMPENGGIPRANPATRVAKDALTSARLALKQLGIALEGGS